MGNISESTTLSDNVRTVYVVIEYFRILYHRGINRLGIQLCTSAVYKSVL